MEHLKCHFKTFKRGEYTQTFTRFGNICYIRALLTSHESKYCKNVETSKYAGTAINAGENQPVSNILYKIENNILWMVVAIRNKGKG